MNYPTYYSSPISENIEETPEGFLICHDVPIARTGWQTYKVSELPKAAADRAGVDTSNGQADIDLYRDPEDVFAVDTIASFEGKPVTDNHPPDFVEPGNFKQYACGHLQNVREGSEPLESGDYPLLADLFINAEPLLSKVRNGITREVSCGYDYSLHRDGDKVLQVDITGNHVAVVPKGRAGPEARINDSAPAATLTSTEQPKEKKPVSNILRHLLGLGLKAYATDADPEKLAEAAEAVKASGGSTARANDSEPEPRVDDRHADDRRGRDTRTDDRRARAHAALDRMFDNNPNMEMGSEQSMDADLDELENLLGDYLGEEAEEPQHAEDEEEEGAEQPPEEEESEPSGEEVVESVDRGRAADSRPAERVRTVDARGGAMRTLRVLRPFVARSNDRAMKEAFNTALATVSRASRASSGSYGAFANTARARDEGARRPKTNTTPIDRQRGRAADAASDPLAKLQKAYDNAREGK